MNDVPEHGRPSALIWLHLLREGEFKSSAEIRYDLRDHHFAKFDTTLKGLRDRGIVSVRKVEGKWARYGVTLACRVPQGLTVAEVLEAAAEAARAG